MWTWKELADGGIALMTGDALKRAITVDKNGAVQFPAGTDQGSKYSDVSVSSAELLALFGTPKVIVPAPGAGFANVFQGAVIYQAYNSIVYTVPGTSELSVKYTDASGLEVSQCETTGFLDQATNQTRYLQPHHAASGNNGIVPVANAPLVLQTLIANVTAGNSPLKLRTYYRVIPTTL